MAGYIYLIGSSLFGWYKIGKSISPETRVKDLGILLPFKIEVFAIWKSENHHLIEKYFHDKYKAYHINGEWFSFKVEDIKEILQKEVITAFLVFSKDGENKGKSFSTFSNIRSDAPEGMYIKLKIKKFYTPEEHEAKKQASIAKQAEKKAAKALLDKV